jgi:FkbM family methyltransferase
VRVYSFEPVASNFAWLRKNVEESGLKNVQIFQQAVAGSAGQKPLFIEPTSGMFHSLFNDVAIDKSKRHPEMVECTTLDDIFKLHQIERCDLLKLDCEGAEYEILTNSSPETLNRVRKIAGEWHEGHYPVEALRQVLESGSFQIDNWRGSMFHARNTADLQS